MGETSVEDAVDQVVKDVRQGYPQLQVVGLPITGRVLRLAQHLAERREEVLSEFGLTVADFDVLASLRRRAGRDTIKIRDLQRSMMLSSGGMTKRLDRLESLGLLERRPDPTDRRGVLIRLSKRGLQVIDRALPAITRSESKLVSEAIASPDDRRHVEEGLRQMLVAQEAI